MQEESDFPTEEYNKLATNLNLDLETKHKAKLFIKKFLKSPKFKDHRDKLKIISGCCIYIASKCREVKSVDGKQVSEGWIGANQIIKSIFGHNMAQVNIKSFLEVLRSVYTTISLPQGTIRQLKSISIKYAFIHLFYIQFEKILQYINLSPSKSKDEAAFSHEYYKSLKTTAWLFFIIFRDKKNKLPKNANLMLSSLSYVLKNSSVDLTIEFLLSEKGEKAVIPGESKGQLQGQILEYLCKLMNFNCDDETHAARKEFDSNVKELLVGKFGLEEGSLGERMTDSKGVVLLYTRLQDYYEKTIGFDDMDESIFVKESRILTPLKFTPFVNQSSLNQRYIGAGTLDRFNETGGMKSITIRSRLTDNVNFPNYKQTGVQAKKQYVVKTNSDGFVQFSEMYQWLKEIVNEAKVIAENVQNSLIVSKDFMLTSRLNELYIMCECDPSLKLLHQVQQEFCKGIEELEGKESQNLQSSKQLNLKFFLCVLEKLMDEEYNTNGVTYLISLIMEKKFLKAVSALCLEINAFIRDDTKFTLKKILPALNISAFDIWRVVISFSRSFSKIPIPIKRHLNELEVKSLFELCWLEGSPVIEVIQDESSRNGIMSSIENEMEPIKQNPVVPGPNSRKYSVGKDSVYEKSALTLSHEVFFKRLLKLLGERVFHLCNQLELDKSIVELVWEIVKFTVSECAAILPNMHMDHIVICSVYASCKKFKLPISFSRIFQRYQKLIYIKTDINQKNIKDNGKLINLKEFYNQKFLNKATRGFITTQAEKISDTLPENINVRRVSQSSFRYTEGKFKNKNMLKRMNLDSPLHKTIPNLLPNSECSVTLTPNAPLIPLKTNRMSLKKISLFQMSPKYRELYAGESPYDFKTSHLSFQRGITSKRMLKFDKLDNKDQIRKKLKISSELLTKKSLADLHKFKPKMTKNFKIQEKPISEWNEDEEPPQKEEEENSGEESPNKPQTPTFQ